MWPRELRSAYHKEEASVDKELEENRTSWEIVKTKGAAEAWEARTGRYAISVC